MEEDIILRVDGSTKLRRVVAAYDISFDLRKGNSGPHRPNGSGKTTLVNLITGL